MSLRIGVVVGRPLCRASEVVTHANERLVSIKLTAIVAEVAVAVFCARRNVVSDRIFNTASDLPAVKVFRCTQSAPVSTSTECRS